MSSVDTHQNQKKIQQTTNSSTYISSESSFSYSKKWALTATIQAILNSYLRETKQFDPRVTAVLKKFPLLQKKLISRTDMQFEQPYEMILIELPFTGRWIQTGVTYYSLIGQHQYINHFGCIEKEQSVILNIHQLIDVILEELSHYADSQEKDSQKQQMVDRIQNSLTKMEYYHHHHADNKYSNLKNYIYSEQSLIAGHPFHPFPKSSEGFAIPELALYSPEMGASFQLYYIAVQSTYIDEQWLDEQHRQEAITPSVHQQANHFLQTKGVQADQYTLLPMHPWQAKYIQTLAIVQHAIQYQHLIVIGALGDLLYPTSSVRTVWNPKDDRGYKLPLHIRITNLIRENTPEQAKRTIDAARIIHHQRTAIESNHFKVLTETGYSSVNVDRLSKQWMADLAENPIGSKSKSTTNNQSNSSGTVTLAEQEQWTSALTVIYRPQQIDAEHTYVVASLLETAPYTNEPKLISVIRQHAPHQVPHLSAWLSTYTEITLLSLLRVFADYGISFEAHLQNSLISFKDGMPSCYYVRDLEGVSIDRTCPAVEEWIQPLIEQDSHVLYDRETAWLRTGYYFVVNHLGSLIHTIAAYEQRSEQDYWNIVQHQLVTWRTQAELAGNSRLCYQIDSLLHVETLPAKANFISCFQAKGDHPSFIAIPNPLYLYKR